MTPSRAAVRLAVPAAIVAGLVTVMVGCLPIPTGDRLTLTGTKQDFRPLVAEARPTPRSEAGGLTRAGIERVLGPAPYQSPNGLRVVYTMRASNGLWVIPLCFVARSMQRKTIAVEFVYSPDGVVLSEYVVENVEEFSPPTGYFERPPVAVGPPGGDTVNDLIHDVERGAR